MNSFAPTERHHRGDGGVFWVDKLTLVPYFRRVNGVQEEIVVIKIETTDGIQSNGEILRNEGFVMLWCCGGKS